MNRKLFTVAATAAATAAVGGVAAAASAPTTITGRTTNIRQTSAVLQGSVNPNGASTTYYFQWGLTTSYGVHSAPHSAGSGSRPRSVSQQAKGLVGGTTYHYRLVATNRFGTAVGRDRAFKTAGHPPPGALTGSAVALSSTGAILTGDVFPSGQRTTWWFQFGPTTSYGQRTSQSQTAAGTAPVSVAASLGGRLTQATIYHFRLVASHRGLNSFGADQSFMTYPSVRPVPAITAHSFPFHPRRRPYVIRTAGSLTPPSAAWDPYACNGNVTIRFFRGLRQVGFTLAGIQPNCTFFGRTVFFGIPGGRRLHPHRAVRLRIVIRSISNHYLSTNRAPIEHTLLG